ncbi:MAG: DUF5060 domain-containing protein [Bacteroidales bacterium]|nr:DUF5060 domain-containing protein [Bacteroidales bacterium]
MRIFAYLLLFLSLLPLLLNGQPQVTQISLSADSVDRYSLLEITVGLQATYTNAYDPSQASLEGIFMSPSGDSLRMPGFFMQPYTLTSPDQPVASGPPVWRIRFSPDAPGNWQFKLRLKDASGETSTQWTQFFCLPSTHPGFVRGTSGNYFRLDNGQAFITLGENLAWGIPEGSFAVYERWMDSLAANGANFVKLMMVPWSLSIEWDNTGLGNYAARQDRARHLDWLLQLARERNIRVQFAFMIHDVLASNTSNHWASSPYNQLNGGPCANVTQFFTDSIPRQKFTNYLRYIIARWSAYPEIIAWELISEGDNVQNYNQIKSEVSLWLREMNGVVTALDPYKRPITAGFAISANDADYWNHPQTAYTQLHLYDDYPDFGMAMYDWSRSYMERYPKPFIVGEMGLSHQPDTIIKYDPDGIAFRNALWTTMLSGALGSGMHWWWDNYIDPQGLYRHFRGPGALLQLAPPPDSTWKAFRPELRTTHPDPLVIYPGFQQLFMKPPANHFIVENGGLLEPSVRSLGTFLYGKGSLVLPFRNPPSFSVDFPANGSMAIITGNYVVSSTLQVSVDGIPAFSQDVQANSEYVIPIPVGKHEVLVENINTGNGGCEVFAYAFHPYRSEARAFALVGDDGGIGWLQHQDLLWGEWYDRQGTYTPITDAVMVIPGMPDSSYTVRWVDAWSGQALTSQVVIPSGDSLWIDVPDFAPDLAFVLEVGNTIGIRPEAMRPGGSLSVFPNPSIGPVILNLDLPYSGKVDIQVYDSSGRVVASPLSRFLTSGSHRIPWDQTEALQAGMYIVRMTFGREILTFKMIRQ